MLSIIDSWKSAKINIYIYRLIYIYISIKNENNRQPLHDSQNFDPSAREAFAALL